MFLLSPVPGLCALLRAHYDHNPAQICGGDSKDCLKHAFKSTI